jgi:major membrane immunogen (membrane-anchored lipoprotein)
LGIASLAVPRPILVASTIVAAVLLGACGQKDATESDVHEVLVDAGATEAQADCAAPRIADDLTQDELNDLASASEEKDIPDKIDEKITPILDECLSSENPTTSDETTSTTAEGATTESTTSTTTG